MHDPKNTDCPCNSILAPLPIESCTCKPDNKQSAADRLEELAEIEQINGDFCADENAELLRNTAELVRAC